MSRDATPHTPNAEFKLRRVTRRRRVAAAIGRAKSLVKLTSSSTVTFSSYACRWRRGPAARFPNHLTLRSAPR
jgi:hypothetical protein